MNVPNFLTLLRIFMAIIVFALIGFGHYGLALILFLTAALTDALDGWWARRFKQITVFGRIMDPFADKFLICGVFVYLVTIPQLTCGTTANFPSWLLLQAWMVIVIIGRELLVSSLRAFVEGAGGDFSAKWLGKLKMFMQCTAIIFSLLYLSGGAEWNVVSPDGQELRVEDFERPGFRAELGQPETNFLGQMLDNTLNTAQWRPVVFFGMLVSLWLTFGVTVLSGLDYSIHAIRIIRKQRERLDELKAKRDSSSPKSFAKR